MVFAEQADKLTITTSETMSLQVTGPFAEGIPTDGQNLVLKAAQLLQKLRGVTEGASISLVKNLPHGGGIGGGSSDAATALRLLAELWQVVPLSPAEALPLGADLPVCMLAPDPCFVKGVGEIVEPLPPLPEFWLVLVNPGVHVATARVFALHDDLYEFNPIALAPLPVPNDSNEMGYWLARHRNDLTRVTRERSIAPVVGKIIDLLWQSLDCGCAGMSGSGSTCWGYFQTENAAKKAETQVVKENPDWWVRTTRIGG